MTIREIYNMIHNMKTIAVTIDEATLERIDGLLRSSGGRFRSRSEAVRRALRDLIARLERAEAEEREREIFRRHRGRIRRQAEALVREQARP